MQPQKLILMLIPRHIYITKVSLTEKYYSCLLVLKLDSAAWITCTRPLSEVRFPSVFVSQKPSRTDSPVSKEAAWNGSQLLWTVFFCLLWSRLYGAFDLDSWILTSPAFDSLCWIHMFVHSFTHTPFRSKDISLCFLLVIAQAFKFPPKTKIPFLYSLLSSHTGLQEWFSLCLLMNSLCPDADLPHSLTL